MELAKREGVEAAPELSAPGRPHAVSRWAALLARAAAEGVGESDGPHLLTGFSTPDFTGLLEPSSDTKIFAPVVNVPSLRWNHFSSPLSGSLDYGW